jgi:hypothetical protein
LKTQTKEPPEVCDVNGKNASSKCKSKHQKSKLLRGVKKSHEWFEVKRLTSVKVKQESFIYDPFSFT